MPSYATRRPRSALALRRAALTIAAGSLVVGLGALPTAEAAKDATVSSGALLSEAPSAHGKRAEGAVQGESCCVAVAPATPAPAPPPGEASASGHGRHGQPDEPAASQPVPEAGSGAGAPGASTPPPRKLDRAQASHRRQEGGRSGSATTSAPSVQSAASPAVASSRGDEQLASALKKETGAGKGTRGKEERERERERRKEERKEKKKGGKGEGKEKGKEETGKEEESKKTTTSPEESPREGQSTGKGNDGDAAAADPVADAASVATPVAPVVSPAGGTGDASITSFVPSAKAQAPSGGVRAARSVRDDGKRDGGATGLASSALTGAPALLLAAGSKVGAATGPAPAGGTGGSAFQSSAQPAIVKTITQIVNVVPTSIRILIIALIALALALAARALYASLRTRRLVRQRGELLEDVGLLQAALLPVPPARLGPVGTTVAYRPADGPGAGGDFYDVFALEDGQLAVIVGDVSGHGREALPHTALVRFTVRAYLEAGLSPRKALQTAETVLERQLGDSFATVLAATYHPRTRELTYASAGHPPPVVLSEPDSASPSSDPGATLAFADADVDAATKLTTACSAPPIGAGMRTGTRETVISVPGAARLCFHTDGVTEARVGEDLFGPRRLADALARLGSGASAADLLDRVVERTDARPDDMAACLLRVAGGAGEPAVVHELLEADGAAIDSGRAARFLQECGVTPERAVAAIESARREVERSGRALFELRIGEDGTPRVTLGHDNVIRAAALTAVGAS